MRRGVPVVVLVLACLLLVGLETPLGSLAFGAECAQSCPDDVAEGRCSPVCLTCACPSQARAITLPHPVPGAGERPVECLPVEAAALAPTPRGDVIEHVPKPRSC